jgi:hypothetical protein
LIRGEECFIGHVGDSRIYLRSNGKLNRITKDHSFVQTLVDSGVIDDEDAETHPNKNQILQALGIAPSVKATICQSAILPKASDMFLLCSDGLNGMVNDRDMEQIMQEDNLLVTSENLITAALNGGGHDNVTASLVLIEESAHASSRFVHFNPKPKVQDMTSTQQFGGGSTKSVKKKSMLPYIIAGAVLLFGAGVVLMMMMGKEEAPVQAVKLLTQNDLENYVCQNVGDIKLDMKVSFESDTVKNNQCEGTTHVFIVEDSSITEVYTEKILKSNDSDDDKPEGEASPTVSKKIEEMSKKEIKALNVGTSVLDEKGDFDRHGFKIVVEKNKVKSKVKVEKQEDQIIKTHTVKDQENLSKIVSMYINVSPGLTVEALKDFNVEDKKSALTSKQKEDLSADKIAIGMKLKIPKIAK